MSVRTLTGVILAATLQNLRTTSVTQTTIALAWDAYPGATAYRVYRSTTQGSLGTLVLTPTETTYSNSGHTAGTTYYYTVRPVVGGSGVASAGASLAVTTAGGSWQLGTGRFETAKIPLEIVAPRSGLSTANRYYKAYPGIEYRVPVAVLGGAWPFRYQLTTAPSGMTVGETYGVTNYGVIVWPSPVEGTHSVSLLVTDQSGATATVSWSLTVTTSGFLFLDSVNGNDANAGTLASPKRTIGGWYLSGKNDATYQGQFIYYRSGTYNWNSAVIEDGYRIAMTGAKPAVHLAYPGESVTHNVAGACPWWYSASGNQFISGLVIAGVATSNAGKGLCFDSGSATNCVIFANTFQQDALVGPDTNQCHIFFADGGNANYAALIGNSISCTQNAGPLLLYRMSRVVIENNTITNVGGDGNQGLYLKSSYSYVSIRNNRSGVGTSGGLFRLDGYGTVGNNVEACWNSWRSTGRGWSIGWQPASYGPFWSYRNTWAIRNHEHQNATGLAMTVTGDVTQHSGTYANGVYLAGTSAMPTYTNNELNGIGPFVDSSNLLTGSAAAYRGTRGHEVA